MTLPENRPSDLYYPPINRPNSRASPEFPTNFIRICPSKIYEPRPNRPTEFPTNFIRICHQKSTFRP